MGLLTWGSWSVYDEGEATEGAERERDGGRERKRRRERRERESRKRLPDQRIRRCRDQPTVRSSYEHWHFIRWYVSSNADDSTASP
jgi:hypothetical protein